MKSASSLQEQIQDLADGRLDFGQRAALLRDIDGTGADHWRALALALVERDILSEALAAEPRARATTATRGWLAAACVALGCFFLGLVARPRNLPETVAASVPPAPAAPGFEYPVPSASLVREANARLAPTGYEASLLTRYVRTNLDGREVVIPLSQVRLDYRGL